MPDSQPLMEGRLLPAARAGRAPKLLRSERRCIEEAMQARAAAPCDVWRCLITGEVWLWEEDYGRAAVQDIAAALFCFSQ